MKAGWKIKKLGEVCDFQNGFAFKSNLFKDNGLPVLRISNIQDNRVDTKNVVYFSVDDYRENLDKYRILKDDLLIAMSGGTTGKIGFNTSDRLFYLNQRVGKFEPKKSLLKKYLFYLLSTKVEENLRISLGSAQPNLSTEQIKNLEIPLPPIDEQRRIVAILDEAFADIAAAKENAEQNLKNAKEVFESHLEQAVYQENENWRKTTVGSEVDLISGFPFKSYGYTDSEESVKLLRGDNIVQGKIRWDDVKKWPKNDIISYNSYLLCSGDVVLAMDRPWVNAGLKRAQISSNDLPCLLVQRTARLRGKKIDNRFLFYLISSNAFIQHIVGVQTGIGVPHISGKQIKDFEFFIPPMTEQKNITQQLDSLSAETSRLESLYQQKLSNLEELKKSLLQQAFSGAL